MPTVDPFPAGGYRFIVHRFQYSGGVAAEPGFRIERARFARPLPLAEGFDAIEAYLAGIGRSPTAFCACELRSPAQFTDAGFVAFNRHYVERLARFVLGAMELRMAALGFGWAGVTATQVYTIFDIHPLLADEFVRRGAIPGGLTWHFARPPVQGLDFEVDVRGVAHELVI